MSIVAGNKYEEFTILLEKRDHNEQPSTGGRIKHKLHLTLDATENAYQQEVKNMLQNGKYAQLVRANILDLRKTAYDTDLENYNKYDEAISKYIDTEIAYIKTHGVPKAVAQAGEQKEFNEKIGKLLENRSADDLKNLRRNVETGDKNTLKHLQNYFGENESAVDDAGDSVKNPPQKVLTYQKKERTRK